MEALTVEYLDGVAALKRVERDEADVESDLPEAKNNAPNSLEANFPIRWWMFLLPPNCSIVRSAFFVAPSAPANIDENKWTSHFWIKYPKNSIFQTRDQSSGCVIRRKIYIF